MPVPIEAITEAAADVARNNWVRLAVLFGSYARGTATGRSDIDLIFVEDTDLPYLRSIDSYYDLLVDRLGTPVEMAVYTPAEFENIRDRPCVRRVLEEGLVVPES